MFSSSHELGTKKKFWVPTRNRTSDLRCSTAEPQRLYGERGHITRVLHTARISNVDSVTFVNRIREIVSFELGKKNSERCFSSCHGRGTKMTLQAWRYRHCNIFRELKTYDLSYSIYKHDTIDTADPSSIQDTCHMNFVIELAHRGVSVAQW